MTHSRTLRAWIAVVALSAMVLGGGALAAASASAASARATVAVAARAAERAAEARPWRWPVDDVEITQTYVSPAHAFGPGHRGIDLRAEVGTGVVAPADGRVAFAGAVAGRGVVTIDHGDGRVTTFEPVSQPPPAGSVVRAGDVVGLVSLGGHALAGTVHFGVRLDGEYVNPLLFLDGVPRAVLLPCCAGCEGCEG